MSSKPTTTASCTGSYTGNTDNGFSGSSVTSVTVSTDKVSVTPSVSHSASSGRDTFGGGVSTSVRASDSVTVSATVHSHGGNTTGNISVRTRF